MQPEPYWASDDGDVQLHLGDCLDVLRTLPADSVDAIVTDPPYGLTEISTETVVTALTAWLGGDRLHVPDGRGFMGREWDKFVPPPGVWDEAYRVLKPGGHLLCFAAPRTQDLMGLSIRLAGFKIFDGIAWFFGQGFPKSRDIGKDIDRMAGAERGSVRRTGPVISGKPHHAESSGNRKCLTCDKWTSHCECDEDNGPATPEGARWQGFGTALKPAWEPVIVARKPHPGTVAGNVLRYGTGALNIDACKVGSADKLVRPPIRRDDNEVYGKGLGVGVQEEPAGRWPANLVFTHSAACEPAGTRQVRGSVCGPQSTPGATGGIYGEWDEKATASRRGYGLETVEVWVCAADCPVGELDRQSGVREGGNFPQRRTANTIYDGGKGTSLEQAGGARAMGDSGGASRFYPTFRYQAKAPASERPRLEDGTAHETVKPLGFISWAVRLVTPPGGTVLDMFAGSGPVGEACIIEGFRAVLIEQDPKSAELIRKRLSKPIQPVMFGC